MLDELAGYEEQIIWNVTLSSAYRQIVKEVCEALRRSSDLALHPVS
jgi:hypothetical protein